MPIKINGATSGSTTITAPATGGDESIELSTALASKLDLAGGKILQIVRATDTTNRSTTSTTFVDANISVTITPQKSDSAVILIWQRVTSLPSGGYASFAITDSSNNVLSGSEDDPLGATTAISGGFSMLTSIAYATPATTSAVTYKGRFRSTNGSSFSLSNANNSTGQLYAIEVSA